MQKPEIILNNLHKQSKNKDYKFRRLYRILYNPDFYYRAYCKIYAKEGNMSPGVDGETIDGFSQEKIAKMIEQIKDLSYKPNPAKRVYIPKKNGGQRPLGIPAVMDKIVQEIVREILEAIYEETFYYNSHGFRPERSCHTALTAIKKEFTGVKWWIEGDIKSFFDNIKHHILIDTLREKIEDEKFLNLIWKFLKAGYIEEWKFNNTYSGTPQGGIISPVLSNIYLHKFDIFMAKVCNDFEKGKKRRINKEFKKHEGYIYKKKKKLQPVWDTLTKEEKDEALKDIKYREKLMKSVPSLDPYDEDFRRCKYVRYADDFLIGVIGSRQEALELRDMIKVFLDEKLGIELSLEKTKITQACKKARFLGYDIYVHQSKDLSSRKLNGHVMLSMPYDKMRDFLFKNGYIKEIKNEDGTNRWESIRRTKLLHSDDLETLSTYNAELRGFYEYYKLAHDVYRLGNIYNLVYFSCLKTFSSKYNTSSNKILSNKVKNQCFMKDNHFGVYYETAKGTKFRKFIENSFKTYKAKLDSTKDPDVLPRTEIYRASRNSLEVRLRANTCEYCGCDEGQMEVHHVRKLKDLKGKKAWEKFMIGKRRKTLVLCKPCHTKLHAGKLD